MSAQLQPCGTVAAWKRGCRCPACVEALHDQNAARRRRPPAPPRYVVDAEPWREHAACRTVDNPEVFFPARGDHRSVTAARAICATCPVTADCLAAGMSRIELGVWGGTTERQRKLMRRNR